MAQTAENSPSVNCCRSQARYNTMDDVTNNFATKSAPDDEFWDWRSYGRRMDSGYSSGSSLSRGIHITEFSDSRVNPTPLLIGETDILLEQYLSPGKLQLLAGVDDLKTVESLELKVDSRETSLGNFGSMLPGLLELKLNGSHIGCMRDLGSSLRNLKILWMTRCGLEELDGISAMSELRELYLEYNEISDVSPLSMLEHLEILDLEGNNIEEIVQVQYLSLCPTLRKLALDGNPICVCPTPTDNQLGYDFRGTIKKLLPHLLILDDERLDGESSSAAKLNAFDDDWAYLEGLQGEAMLAEEFLDKRAEARETGDRTPTSALRPVTAYQPGSSLRPSSGFRPASASRRPSTISGSSTLLAHSPTLVSIRATSTDAIEGTDSVSELTMGNVICGNPSKALRQRKLGMSGSKEDIDKKLNKLLQKGAVFGNAEETDIVLSKENGQTSSLIEDLRSWKIEHEKRMEIIYKSKEAQILVVEHDDDDLNEYDSDEGDDYEGDDKDDESNEEISLLKIIEKYDNTFSSSRQDQLADMQHKTTNSKATFAETNLTDIYSRRKMPVNFIGISPLFKNTETAGFFTAENADFSTAETADFSTAKTAETLTEHAGYDQSFDVEEDALESTDLPPKRALSMTGSPMHKQPTSPKEVHKVLTAEVPRSPRCQLSRLRGEANLAPLRVPSTTPAQVVNQITFKPKEVTSTLQKKFRVGSTGLPLSNQAQQPVIRNNIAVIQSRSSLVHSCRAGGSQSNIVLLPSQPRIHTHLVEPAPLIPHPPSSS